MDYNHTKESCPLDFVSNNNIQTQLVIEVDNIGITKGIGEQLSKIRDGTRTCKEHKNDIFGRIDATQYRF